MSHQFKAIIDRVGDSTLMWHFRIIVPDTIFEHYKETDKRVICSINQSAPIHCALMPSGDGSYYIMLNAEFRKKNKLNLGDEVVVEIRKDDSKYGTAVPDFFEEICFQDPEASKHFHNLTPGKQRSILHILCKLKSEQKQLEKTLILFDYLKSVNGNFDFRELNEAFKSNRFKL